MKEINEVTILLINSIKNFLDGGFLLFVAHCKIEPRRNNIMARLHGPCFVQQVRMNSQVLPVPVPVSVFIHVILINLQLL